MAAISHRDELPSVRHYTFTPTILKSYGSITDQDETLFLSLPWYNIEDCVTSLPESWKGEMLSPLPRYLLRKIFFFLSPLEWLTCLCPLNKYFLMLTSETEDWRQFVLDEWHGSFWYIRSWRFTYINEYYRRGYWGGDSHNSKALKCGPDDASAIGTHSAIESNNVESMVDHPTQTNCTMELNHVMQIITPMSQDDCETDYNEMREDDCDTSERMVDINETDASTNICTSMQDVEDSTSQATIHSQIQTMKKHINSNESKNPFRDSMSDMIVLISHAGINPQKLPKLQPDNIQRVPRISVQKFIENYSSICQPVIITGAMKGWPAMKEWQKERFVEKYGNLSFRTDQKYSGSKKNVRIRLDCYYQYLKTCKEDADPIYIFDPKFSSRSKEFYSLHEEYNVEDYFHEDLLAVLGEKKRPRYKWLVVGVQKSGTDFHIDPYQTSAWNALTYGEKRWAFYPRDGLPKHLRKGHPRRTQSEQKLCIDPIHPVPGVPNWNKPLYKCKSYNALKWFTNKYCETFVHGEPPLECLQQAGEIIFVPGSWWHMVLNTTDITIAVTQNMANTQNFKQVYKEIWDYDKKMGKRLKEKLLENNRKDLFDDVDIGISNKM